MRKQPPLLLPLFRSEKQAHLLARVYLRADQPAPLADIAREMGVDRGTLTREADRLERAGLVRSERVGRQRHLFPNESSPYFRDLHGLLLKAFGPAMLLARELADLKGIAEAYIYGSWASRYEGSEGPTPQDIDVLVVGHPSALELARVSRTLSPQLAREVNFTTVSAEDWRAPDSGFLRQVQSEPLVKLEIERHD